MRFHEGWSAFQVGLGLVEFCGLILGKAQELLGFCGLIMGHAQTLGLFSL